MWRVTSSMDMWRMTSPMSDKNLTYKRFYFDVHSIGLFYRPLIVSLRKNSTTLLRRAFFFFYQLSWYLSVRLLHLHLHNNQITGSAGFTRSLIVFKAFQCQRSAYQLGLVFVSGLQWVDCVGVELGVLASRAYIFFTDLRCSAPNSDSNFIHHPF